uniref:Uncharacterized protein n=1 Tax=Ditylenchus dipsaci TaxID=166011 RepID=A0A915CR82_9BILA
MILVLLPDLEFWALQVREVPAPYHFLVPLPVLMQMFSREGGGVNSQQDDLFWLFDCFFASCCCLWRITVVLGLLLVLLQIISDNGFVLARTISG